MIAKYLIVTLIGYIIGSINPSYFIAKMRGFNIRERGSKNPGTSNAFLTMGIKVAVVVGAIDIFKVFLAVLIALPFFHDLPNFHIVCCFSAVMGHMYPFYLGFKGGKGFACLISCMFVVNTLFGTIVILVALAMAGITNYIVVATIICLISTSVFVPMYTNLDILPTVYCLVPAVIIFVKHIPNIIKIAKGEEFHIYKTKQERLSANSNKEVAVAEDKKEEKVEEIDKNNIG